MKWVALVILLLGGCGERSEQAAAPVQAGAKLELAARNAGLVEDPATVEPTGVYTSDTDRACIVPVERGYRVGATIDYGPGQGCVARGSATGRSRLAIAFGEGCAITATVADGRLVFPATVPAACDRLCSGRASLAALSAERLSGSTAEAAAMRAPDRSQPCRSQQQD